MKPWPPVLFSSLIQPLFNCFHNCFLVVLLVYYRIRLAVWCHGPTKSVWEERGGVWPEAGEPEFTHVHVSRRGSLLRANPL